ncbi:MAG: stage 0 sporulation family protein [Spirochaetaceae bacterium]
MADRLPRVLNASPSIHASCGLCEAIGAHTPFLVKVLHSSETELCVLEEDGGIAEVNCGDLLVVNTRYGGDLARVLGPVQKENSGAWEHEREVLRHASDADIARFEDNLRREEDAFRVCREKIDGHGLSMKLVSAHYVLDEPKILFFFTAESRVDFRDLVKDLVSEFHMRIELRQIGVRDNSRLLGGTGVCGRVLCCHGFTDKLRPVSIKMAKVQNLSLNSMKISGPCGRLLCCLAYEYDHYTEQKRKLPGDGSRINYDGSTFQVFDVNVISNRVRLVAREEGRYITVSGDQLAYDQGERRWSITGEIPPGE